MKFFIELFKQFVWKVFFFIALGATKKSAFNNSDKLKITNSKNDIQIAKMLRLARLNVC